MNTVTEPLREEHRNLVPHLGHILALADEITEGSNSELAARVRSIHTFLVEDLLHHAQVEERALYPVVAQAMGASEATRTMSRDHIGIARMVDELGAVKDGLESGRIDAAQAREIRRLLYGLHAMVKLHFLKEEEVYLPLLDARLSETEGVALLEALREAGAAV